MSESRHDSRLRHDRRGAAVAVIVLLILAVTGLGLLAMRQGQQSITLGRVNTDSQRALALADACAAAAVKTLPVILDTYMMFAREGSGIPPIVPAQFGSDFFGTPTYGPDSPYTASCTVELEDIQDDAPAPGYSEGGGCFKRITLRSTGTLVRTSPSGVASSDFEQAGSATERQVLVRGLFGPTNCY